MTIAQAISLADNLEENRFPIEAKIKWLAILDGKVWKEVIATHELPEDWIPLPYDYDFAEVYEDSDPNDTRLLVLEPYTDVYIWYLQAQIQLLNGDTARYNQSILMFNNAFQSFQDAWNREHLPVNHFHSFKV